MPMGEGWCLKSPTRGSDAHAYIFCTHGAMDSKSMPHAMGRTFMADGDLQTSPGPRLTEPSELADQNSP